MTAVNPDPGACGKAVARHRRPSVVPARGTGTRRTPSHPAACLPPIWARAGKAGQSQPLACPLSVQRGTGAKTLFNPTKARP